jgi:bacterioferritin-associated ferredoxin
MIKQKKEIVSMEENQNLNSELLDKLTKVCICKGISRATMKNAIKNGAATLAEVQKVTGAGSGPCGGRRCTPKLLQLLEEQEKAQ